MVGTKISMDDVVVVLCHNWHNALEKAPTLSKEILRYYAHLWNRGRAKEEIAENIMMVLDGRLSSPSYPYDRPWYEDFERVKNLYVAYMLKQYDKTILYTLDLIGGDE